ncbi:hypothetical protein TTHERM_000577118 (macronuclear) [Tetrahymena thermophila SB210]|uniref:Uncharacterized protein n=1 Tax=Tetrahymena thermophila (strain SB210) TaxID=312017 RepID=W7XDS3_TETTS|nr:hypothetical protein TTHERM_000577118 [Tetrahymena thermophila SB210]EWS75732.1 hypothetical protein TTHERM_000577118 [Tetrahymena thermophila SB210]|eukprot:XP_012651654.1 hypothetical protein TTHERM_000577118 [Tetrahymena thermophila SB210]
MFKYFKNKLVVKVYFDEKQLIFIKQNIKMTSITCLIRTKIQCLNSEITISNICAKWVVRNSGCFCENCFAYTELV